jgi:hypothetical protein
MCKARPNLDGKQNMVKLLHATILGVAAFWSQPLLACRGLFAESYVVNAKPPAALPAGAIVLEVKLKMMPDPYQQFWKMKPIRATVLRVVQGEYRGREITLSMPSITSCDQLASGGSDQRALRGFVVGRLLKTSSGGVVLNPITQRASPPTP